MTELTGLPLAIGLPVGYEREVVAQPLWRDLREEVPEEEPQVTPRPYRTESPVGEGVEGFLAAGLTEVGVDTDLFTPNGYLMSGR